MIRTLVICGLLSTVLAQDSVTFTTTEEAEVGTFVGNVKEAAILGGDYTTSDVNRLTFSILTPPEEEITAGNHFSINNSTGILSVRETLDRDDSELCQAFSEDCLLSFDVAIGPNELFRVLRVHVYVTDINDNAPAFSVSEVYVNMSEVSPVASTFPLPVVTDRDGEEFTVKKIQVTPPSRQFTVKWTRGVSGLVKPRLELLEVLDREQVATFDLTITASDGGGTDALTDTLLVHVDVTDANDNAPHFQQPEYEARIPENARPGSSLLTVRAEDQDDGDNGQLTYSLAEATLEEYEGLFEIHPDSGVITIQTNLDREIQEVYFLGVVATDHAAADARQGSSTVTVFVDDVNDNAPLIRLRTITASGVPEIAESADLDTFVALISVTDPDWGKNSEVTCTLNTDSFHLVAMPPNKYKVVSSVQLDRERQSTITIQISCSDHGLPQKSSREQLTVHVTDVNDNYPIFESGHVTLHVPENTPLGTELRRMRAHDLDSEDNGAISYSLSESYSRYLAVDEKSGRITTIGHLDRERTPTINVHVIARDHGEPALSTVCAVTVTVDDVNDNAPRFNQSSYRFFVAENENEPRLLGTLSATDDDAFPYDQLEYSLTGLYADHFSIDPEDGSLYAIRSLDRETTPLVTGLQALATDLSNRTLIGTTNITVYVSDVNDNAPVMRFPSPRNSTLAVSNQLPSGYVLTRIQAEDPDEGQSADLEYYVRYHSKSDSDLFAVDARSGILSVRADLTEIPLDHITCTVIVKDNGVPSLVSENNLTIVFNESWLPTGDVYGGGVAGNALGSGEEESGADLTVILAVVAVTVVLVAVLVAAIVCVLRKNRLARRRSKPKVETVDLTGNYDVEHGARGGAGGATPWDIGKRNSKGIAKIYNPNKLDKTGGDTDRDSCGSAEGSTTDSGRGASEEGEHGDHGVKGDAKMTSVFPGADDSIISSNYEFNTSYDHVTTTTSQRRHGGSHKHKNVTFEDDVTVTEIGGLADSGSSSLRRPDLVPVCPLHPTGPPRHSPRAAVYSPCPSVPPHHDADDDMLAPNDVNNTTASGRVAPPRRTLRNIKAKDRSKKHSEPLSGILLNPGDGGSQGVIQHSTDCPAYVHGQSMAADPHHNSPYNFSDSNSLLRYKCRNEDGSTGNVSEMTDATSTTSGSYVIDADDVAT